MYQTEVKSPCEHEPKKAKGLCENYYARMRYRAAHPPKPKQSMCEHVPSTAMDSA
jgi:hypothetical protein